MLQHTAPVEIAVYTNRCVCVFMCECVDVGVCVCVSVCVCVRVCDILLCASLRQ